MIADLDPANNSGSDTLLHKDLVGEHLLVSGEQLYILYRGSTSRINRTQELLFIDRVSTRQLFIP